MDIEDIEMLNNENDVPPVQADVIDFKAPRVAPPPTLNPAHGTNTDL
jgi:hypothetical protein